MATWPAHPAVYEVNTWVWLRDLGREHGLPVSLQDVPHAELERLAALHFDGVWLMGLWERSPAGRRIAQEDARLQMGYRQALPDSTREDVIGSPYAVRDYRVDPMLGGDAGLAELRERLRQLGLLLILDFVPNHLAIDHRWVTDHPDRLVQGSPASLQREPNNYFQSAVGERAQVFAHGRDPSFDGWTDTVQLDYRRPETRQAMADALVAVAERCDGVRCDMAMLVTHDVFLRTWGGEFDPPGAQFWPAGISAVRARYPDFLMLAEVYWDMEYELQKLGFDYTYDKRLYDRLVHGDAASIRAHLGAGLNNQDRLDNLHYQRHLARFVENHDEQRAVATFGMQGGLAAAAAALTLPGFRLFHEGQLEGARLRLPVQLGRRHPEPAEPGAWSFYRRLLAELADPVFHNGEWRLLEPREAWGGNSSYQNFVAYCWTCGDEYRLVIVNMAPDRSQCYVPVGFPARAGETWEFCDLLSDRKYPRRGEELQSPGLYLDLEGYDYHLFRLSQLPPDAAASLHGVELRCTFQGHEQDIYGVAWSPDGRLLASGGKEQTILVWAAEDGRLVHSLTGHQAAIDALAWSPDGQLLASGSDDNTIRIWEVATETPVRTLESHWDNVLSVAWSPDGQLLASGSVDHQVILWDIKTARPSHVFAEHTDAVNCVAWSPDGRILASASGDTTIRLWDIQSHAVHRLLKGGNAWISSISWSPDGRILAAGAGSGSVDVWDVESGRQLAILQGHTTKVLCVAFSYDGRLLVSKSADDTVRFWRSDTVNIDTWVGLTPPLAEHGEYLSGLAYHPDEHVLATRDDRENVIHVWGLDPQQLATAKVEAIRYTTARIVLVGDSGVGKTGLGWRLAHGEFKEHPSTHGQQFWLLDELGVARADGAQCEAILWDLAGQPDYRLIHALFLDDADVALILFDPTRDDDPLRGVDYWLRQLGAVEREPAAEGRKRGVILVAARADRGVARLTADDIGRFCAERGIRSHVTTSASTGDGLADLVTLMRGAVDWGSRPATVTTATFKWIKDAVLGLKQSPGGDRVIVSPAELREMLEREDPEGRFTDAEMLVAVGHLVNHGYVALLRTSRGESRILLAPELLNNLAASIVLEARRNPKGLGSLEEQRVLTGDYAFPELHSLDVGERDVLLDSAVAMFLAHSVCFRETDPLSSRVYLVFPGLINLKRPTVKDPELVSDGVAYTVTGAVENVYALLVVLLGYTDVFARANQWRNQAEYVVGDGLVCGFRLEAEREGELDFVLYFGSAVGGSIRMLFQGLFESFLARRDLTVRRFEPVTCSKGHQLNRAVVREQLADGNETVFCTRCGERLLLPHADVPIQLGRRQSGDLDTQRRAADQRSRFEQTLFRLKTLPSDAAVQPTCFISYAWGDPEHEQWVERELARDLAKAGITVILDRWENSRIGASVPRFVEQVASADRVVVVGTRLYRTKYNNKTQMGGFVVAAEGDLIGHRLTGTESRKQTVLPVLLDGTVETALPPLLHGRVYSDFRQPDRYFLNVFNLILSVHEIPPNDPTCVELRQYIEDSPR